LRWEDTKLFADHSWLELHRASVSTARRNPQWQVDFPAGDSAEVTRSDDVIADRLWPRLKKEGHPPKLSGWPYEL
jgi:hypothetical protein